MAERSREGSVVLVHGLWHVPAHFDLVATGLRASGVEVVVPELHRGSLAADTAAVQAAVDALADAESSPPVVLGHSYGGSVITGLTSVAHLLYVAAFVPDSGRAPPAWAGLFRGRTRRCCAGMTAAARSTPVAPSRPCTPIAHRRWQRGR